jgi:hypothetical protein
MGCRPARRARVVATLTEATFATAPPGDPRPSITQRGALVPTPCIDIRPSIQPSANLE